MHGTADVVLGVSALRMGVHGLTLFRFSGPGVQKNRIP